MKPYEYLLPTCCEPARLHSPVYLCVKDDGEACWLASTHAVIHSELAMERPDVYYHLRPAASFCPYCGERLPKMRKRAVPPEPLCRPDEEGFYCLTCRRRANECHCLPPEAAWEPDVSP